LKVILVIGNLGKKAVLGENLTKAAVSILPSAFVQKIFFFRI
jgi:hypothetical protein